MADLPPESGPSEEKLKQIKKKRIPRRRTLRPDEVPLPADEPTVSAFKEAPSQTMSEASTTKTADKSVLATDEEPPAKDPAVESFVASKPTFAMSEGRSYAQRGSPRPRVCFSASPSVESRGTNTRRASYPLRMLYAARPNTPRVCRAPPPQPLPLDDDSDWEFDN